MSKIVLICGSRKWTDRLRIRRRIAELPEGSIVIHGGADGADNMAGQEAQQRGLHTAVVRPLWRVNGKYDASAGHKRNAAMLDLKPSLVIAFTLGSPGTQGTIDGANMRRIPVEIHGVDVPCPK